MSKKSIVIALVTCLAMVFTTFGTMQYSFAGEEGTQAADETKISVNSSDESPLISLNVVNPDAVDANEGLTVSIEIKYFEPGIDNVELIYSGGGSFSWAASSASDRLSTAGNHTITLTTSENSEIPEGSYTLESVSLFGSDREALERTYSENLKGHDIIGDITVTTAKEIEKTAPVINSLTVKNADDVDADGNLEIEIDLTEEDSGVQDISLYYKNETNGHTGGVCYFTGEDEQILFTNKHTINCPIINSLAVGEYKLKSIAVSDGVGNSSYYVSASDGDNTHIEFTDKIKGDIKVTKSKLVDLDPPEIKSLEVTNTGTIKLPNVLKIDLSITEEGSGVNMIDLIYTNTDNHESSFTPRWETAFSEDKGSAPGLKTGSHTISIPLDPFREVGRYALSQISIMDEAGNSQNYYLKEASDDPDSDSFEANNIAASTITLTSSFTVAAYGSTSDVGECLNLIDEMSEGEVVVITYGEYVTAPASLFEAIAGKDKTIVFQNEDVQWVFNGKNISPDKCKDINLRTLVWVKSGKEMGFPDEEEVIEIEFADNGELPGKVDMRINYAYLTAKFANKTDTLILSHMDGTTPKVEQEDVKIDNDSATVFNLTHNSAFVLSSTMPRLEVTSLIPAKLRTINNGLSSIRLTWNKVDGAKSYTLFRAKSKKGSYVKIAALGENTVNYTDKKLKGGNTYYYKVLTAGGQNVKSVYSSIVSGKAILKTPTATISKNSQGNKITVSWGKVSKAKKYKVYRKSSKNKKWKSVAITKKTSYKDKKIKKNVTYYYRVKALNKKSKYNSNSSNVVDIKL